MAAGLADFAQEVATLTPEAQAHQDRVMTVVIVQTITAIRAVAAAAVQQGKIVRARVPAGRVVRALRRP